MALKRLPSDLSFDAVRNQRSPLAKGGAKAPDAVDGKTETLKDKKTSLPDAHEPETKAAVSETNADKPGKTQEDPPIVEKPAARPSSDPEPQPATRVAGQRSSPRPDDSETIKIRARISPPADGVTPLFDSVKSIYDEKAAFKHLINVALKSYEQALLSGDKRALEQQPGFASHPPSQAVFPSRVISRAFYDAAKAVIDPLSIMGSSSLGTAIMRNAIGWYVARNPTKD